MSVDKMPKPTKTEVVDKKEEKVEELTDKQKAQQKFAEQYKESDYDEVIDIEW